MATRIPAQLAVQVMTRATGRCEYCHAPQILIGQAFHIDHIVPRSAKGQTVLDNLCLACSHCNIAKREQTSAIDPRTEKRVMLFNPRADVWRQHFRWSKDWHKIIGRTPVGRATVEALDMNAKILCKARYFWRVVGLIP